MRVVSVFLIAIAALVVTPAKAQQLYAFAYHDVVRTENDDRFSITRDEFRAHLEYFRRYGFQPISLSYLKKAARGQLRLPERAVLLTFDDGLSSYRDIVVPMLEQYGYPSVLSVESGWPDQKRVPAEYSDKVLDWKSIRKLSRSPLVEIVSHSDDLHHSIPSNPQGNVAYAGVTRQYQQASGGYESEKQFRRRIRGDLKRSVRRFRKELGTAPAVITWPYGAYDRVTAGIASSLGFGLQLTLDEGSVFLEDLPRIKRFLVTSATDVSALKAITLGVDRKPDPVRFVDFDLDALVGVIAVRRELRLSRLLDGLQELRVNAVVVDGLTRDQRSTVFYGEVMPSAADVLNRVMYQIFTRLGIDNRYVRLPANLELRNRKLFFKDLARLNGITGVIFEGPGTPYQLDKIKQIVRTYRPGARFGYYGRPASPGNYDFVIEKVQRRDITAMPVRPTSPGRYVSLITPDVDDASLLARAMYELREKGVTNYGFRNLDLIRTKQTYPQVITELSVDSAPARATGAETLFFFVFFYPLFMAIFWMMGSIMFYFRREWGHRTPPVLDVYPHVSILVPCHNEELCVQDTIDHLDKNNYPHFDIIVINDGSTDNTANLLEESSARVDKLRVITLTRNYGKAKALQAGATASQGEFLMCIDADALLDKDALFWMMEHFLSGPRVGAVTGNPRVINRNSLLSRIQIGEFSAIVGMIKRTQRSIGRLFTVSGVNACYRRSAVHKVGYWSSDTVTEDVDMSWRLQLAHWDIRYEPKALTWILVPESFKGLWNQRLRWARGGFEAATHFASNMRAWRSRRMWTVFVEYWVGVLWCFALASTFVFWAATLILPAGWWPESLVINSLLPGWTGVILAVTCLVQFTVGLGLDSKYEKRGLMRYLFWAIWYPALYWVISAATTVAAILIGIKNISKSRTGLWSSPGRAGKSYPDLRRTKHKELEGERRQYFHKRTLIRSPQRATELLMTVLFWGLWSYLITPLVSLMLWFVGIYLFTERMITMGGYQAFADQLINYTTFIAAMGLVLALWVVWNQQRYGRRDKRNVIPGHVSEAQVEEVTGLDQGAVEELRRARKIAMHYRDGQPVIENKTP
ncbi:MAG: poly-beta-1,6-N-acetyl-D-glucosamine synthase [Acidiferrobacterales bacterium]